MNYFSLASQNSKLERNEAFSAEIILYFIRNTGNYLTFLEFTFHIIYIIQCVNTKIMFFFKYLIHYA